MPIIQTYFDKTRAEQQTISRFEIASNRIQIAVYQTQFWYSPLFLVQRHVFYDAFNGNLKFRVCFRHSVLHTNVAIPSVHVDHIIQLIIFTKLSILVRIF